MTELLTSLLTECHTMKTVSARCNFFVFLFLASGLSIGPALLPDVSAWHHADRAGGLRGQSDTGSKAD